MDREMAAAEELPDGVADGSTSARWRTLCERFDEIQLGAYRHDLIDTWRELACAEPNSPGLLAQWEQLDEQILVLDQQESGSVTRHWNGYIADSDDDDWADEAGEYVCPQGRCDRRLSSPPGAVPRCELFRREMTPQPFRPRT
jgi:hypothetical protein